MKTNKEKLHYLIRKSNSGNYNLYDVQIFREYGQDRKYYSQILRFNLQSNYPDNFLKSYGFSIQAVDLYYLDNSVKILKLLRPSVYSQTARNLIATFNKLKIKKITPNVVFSH